MDFEGFFAEAASGTTEQHDKSIQKEVCKYFVKNLFPIPISQLEFKRIKLLVITESINCGKQNVFNENIRKKLKSKQKNGDLNRQGTSTTK